MRPNFSWMVLTAILLEVMSGLLSPAPARTTETLYVKTTGAKLREGNSFRSRTLQKLNAGTPVKVLEKTKTFYKVSLPNGREGWILKLKLTSRAPAVRREKRPVGGLRRRPRIAALESTSGSSIRGLVPASKKYAKDKGIPEQYIQAIMRMESYAIPAEELDQFLKEGKLGEYAP